jgi:hypothetical protein
MKGRSGKPDSAMERGDERTLTLSTVRLGAALLRQLLVFERTLRMKAPAGSTPDEVARAHAAALTASGLTPTEVEAPLALLRRFAANRAVAQRLSERLVELARRPATDDAVAQQSNEIRWRLAALNEALALREDASTRGVLEAHSKEILSLFAATTPDG